MIKVAILTFENTALFELGCAVELFALRRPEFESWYKAEVVSFDTGPLSSTGGIAINVKRIKSLSRYDMLLVPSWPTEQTAINEKLCAQINAFHQKSKPILSFCSGAFLLGEVGILDNRCATTHWRYAELFKQRFPAVDYVEDVLYVLDESIGCSAGSAAAIDLGLAVIRRDFGYEAANQVARRLVISPHRKGGQSQFVETPVQRTTDTFSATLDWALENLTRLDDVNALADKAHMSRRSFDRKFRASIGCSPQEWIITQRLDLARGLLESKQSPVEVIADQSGFKNAASMRHHFRKNLGVSPRQYRDQFSPLTNSMK